MYCIVDEQPSELSVGLHRFFCSVVGLFVKNLLDVRQFYGRSQLARFGSLARHPWNFNNDKGLCSANHVLRPSLLNALSISFYSALRIFHGIQSFAFLFYSLTRNHEVSFISMNVSKIKKKGFLETHILCLKRTLYEYPGARRCFIGYRNL